MNDYIIYTDSGCDIKPSILQEWGVSYSCLTFRFEGCVLPSYKYHTA